jgi:DNA-binding CsgD family transcriptional regulator
MQSDYRAYFRRRSVEEIHAAMRADTIEATNSHIGLAELHLAQCAACAEAATEDCDDCLAVNICLRPASVKALIVRPGSADGDHRPRSVAPEGEILTAGLAAMSPREMQILELVARGLCVREVGHVLGTAPRKVERLLDGMRAKLNARNAPHLITRAIVVGLLRVPILDLAV